MAAELAAELAVEPVEEENRLCRTCMGSKPIESFSLKKTREGRRKACEPCLIRIRFKKANKMAALEAKLDVNGAAKAARVKLIMAKKAAVLSHLDNFLTEVSAECLHGK